MNRRFIFMIIIAIVFTPLLIAHARPVSTNVYSRVLVLRYKQSQGSSFTIEVDGRQYLITAKHVVEGITNGDKIHLWAPAFKTWITEPVEVIKCKNDEVDIIALALPRQITKTYTLEPTMANIIFSQQVYFLGYPKLPSDRFGLRTRVGSGESISELPFIKIGIISAIDSRNKEAEKLYIDGHNNPGFSGGPIVFYHDESKNFRVAGVVSEFPIETWKTQIQQGDGSKEEVYVIGNSGIVMGYNIEHIVDAIRAKPIGPQIQDSTSQ